MDHSTETRMTTSSLAGEAASFSLRRANRALVLVRRIVADVVADYCQLLEIQEILELEQRYGSVEHLNQVKTEMSAAVSRLQGYLEELQMVGVELRDFSRGLVSFPARVAGRDIFFCWQFGEDTVSYWHYRDEEVAGRKPVSELAALYVGAELHKPQPRSV